jgi:hypothetical protein
MTEPVRTPRPVDARTLWAGGVAAALGAALVGLVGIVVCRGLLDVPVLAPQGDGVWGDVDTVAYAGGAALAALVATGLAHLLLLSSPRPGRFFAWIMAVATVAAVLVPFAGTASLASRVATAAINLAVGLAIGALVGAAGRRAVRKASLTP